MTLSSCTAIDCHEIRWEKTSSKHKAANDMMGGTQVDVTVKREYYTVGDVKLSAG